MIKVGASPPACKSTFQAQNMELDTCLDTDRRQAGKGDIGKNMHRISALPTVFSTRCLKSFSPQVLKSIKRPLRGVRTEALIKGSFVICICSLRYPQYVKYEISDTFLELNHVIPTRPWHGTKNPFRDLWPQHLKPLTNHTPLPTQDSAKPVTINSQ
jgi:hypothetical protein